MNVSSTEVSELVQHALLQGWTPDNPQAPQFYVPPAGAPDLRKFHMTAAA